MKLLAAVMIVIAWFTLNNTSQTPLVAEKQSTLELEKRAVAGIQKILASEIDTALPRLPFANWFRQVVGPEAGVVWQLSECGENASAPPNSAGDLPACVEVNTILPDERRVIVLITIGTFKRGMIGAPAFQLGVIEHKEELYTINRLRDLPKLLSEPGSLANRTADKLPDVVMPNMPKVRLTTNHALIGLSWPWNDGELIQPRAIEAPPPPAPPAATPRQKATPNRESLETPTEGLKILGSVTWGGVIKQAQPRYPPSAKRYNISGTVDVQVTISEAGRVTEAKATSGHPLLLGAAEDAARQWVFKPSTLNGVPVETQIVLTFVFKVPQ